ncbi:S8 family peptidase [Micromonospora cathayae]|uniref:S8 family serine peptidase n=1 Tax=Micromonospora cathayae TaxID=3028804 RepID=A0ABY7ZIZ6_9ACTN|nr:S8 family serine peptidase [Micromonospora sp. HUAS 3]WDZ82957.1 S8 family serine peptidase [Micromonospora sp. HUAS 3]
MLPRTPRRHRLIVAGALAASALLAAALTGPAVAAPAVGEIRQAGGPTAVPGSYLVALTDRAAGGPAGTRVAAVSDRADALAARYGGTVGHRYGHALNGFEIRLPEPAARRLAADPAVAWVEQNQTVRPTATQTNAPWNLDFLDQDSSPLSGTYSYVSTGRGVTAYIIDSGIRLTHVEFGGRARYGYDAVDGAPPADDCTGHGTHVAGVVGGRTYGVAKEVSLVAVKVTSCGSGGTMAQVVAGINWVTSDHQAGQPAVANFSLSGAISTALNTAVANSVADGIVYTVAAGNSNTNACNYSPGSVPTAVTVGAVQSNGTRASFSNYGPCVDIYAPGVSIRSAWYTSDTAADNLISGTSQAAPHLAGAAARVLQNHPTWTPDQVIAYLIAEARIVNGLPVLYLDPLT